MRILALSLLTSSLLLAGCAGHTVHVPSQEELAKTHEQNKLLEQASSATTPEAAIEAFKHAGDLGSGKGYYQLAKMYTTDQRVAPDHKLAHEYLLQADALGYNDATIMLAWTTMYGIRTEKDEDRGIEYMKKAAETDVRAKREMGLMYGNMRLPFLDKESRGLSYLLEASEKGDAEAGYYASQLATRLGKADVAKSAMQVAADRGQPKAQLSIGREALAKGQYMIARENFLKSALSYDSEAMFELGKGISEGVFPPTQTV
ncbi:MAG: hypothetical protein RSG77_25575, partial [Hafnia sp.]